MSTTPSDTQEETGRTPSMIASLFVFGVMIALIMLSVVLFGIIAVLYMQGVPGGWWRPFLATTTGVLLAIFIDRLTDYFTGSHAKPVQEIKKSADAGNKMCQDLLLQLEHVREHRRDDLAAHPEGVVVLVDDDDAVRNSLRLLFKTVEIEAVTFESGDAFLHEYDADWQGCIVLEN